MTKKYAAVYQPLVERLQAETEKSNKKGQESAKAVKTKLHQLYGAYTQDNAHKKADAIIRRMEESTHQTDNRNTAILDSVSHYKSVEERGDEAIRQDSSLSNASGLLRYARNDEAAASLLSLHASTKERLPHYAQFYDFILSHIGPVESILDIGCGYNPFSIPLMPEAVNLKAYHAYDIDTRAAGLINRFFACLSLPPLAQCADLAVHIPHIQADLALMCKLIPVLEAQVPGSGFKLARELNTRHLLITYPLKSLGGREKGMAKHYTAAFEKAIAEGELGKFALAGQSRVGDEMLYLLTAV